jgi:superfamily II DNA or RNA helicase
LEDVEKSIVISSSIWDQGVDVPAIETLINVSAGVSTVKTMQKLGRAVRQNFKTEKAFARVIDFDDSEISPMGAKQFKKRLHTYQEVLQLPIKFI